MKTLARSTLAYAVLAAAVGCPAPDGDEPGLIPEDGGEGEGEGPLVLLPAYEQRAGDPVAGRATLLNGGYVGCGIPRSVYSAAFRGDVPAWQKLDGRDEANAELPYNQNAFPVESGVEVVHPNCLYCHASPRPGAAPESGGVVIGLGDPNLDFTADRTATAEDVDMFIPFVTSDPDEQAAARKWAGRVRATAPYLVTDVIGVSSADQLAGVLFAHRDNETLAWSDTPLIEPPPLRPVPTDVPAWWLMKKKHTMFYTGAGRGDHARFMMTASALCVDSVEGAETIDATFADVRAYIASLEPPPYPGEIDEDLRLEGEALFQTHCTRCHGTYGEHDEYPNLLVHNDEVGTDPLLASAPNHLGARFVDWFNESFYGELASFEPGHGYVAPPLDGVWATAPYLHNASVPTLELVLDSLLRPTYFRRSFAPADYDVENPGWPYEELDGPGGKDVYDTTTLGYGNMGHTYGDGFDTSERAAVIEYLKSL